MVSTPQTRRERALDALWDARMRRRRRWDRVYRALNSALFLVLLLASLAFIGTLWKLVRPTFGPDW